MIAHYLRYGRKSVSGFSAEGALVRLWPKLCLLALLARSLALASWLSKITGRPRPARLPVRPVLIRPIPRYAFVTVASVDAFISVAEASNAPTVFYHCPRSHAPVVQMEY